MGSFIILLVIKYFMQEIEINPIKKQEVGYISDLRLWAAKNVNDI